MSACYVCVCVLTLFLLSKKLVVQKEVFGGLLLHSRACFFLPSVRVVAFAVQFNINQLKRFQDLSYRIILNS